MEKLILVLVITGILLTGCANSDASATTANTQTPVVTQEAPKENVSSEEIMKRVDTSTVGESVPVPDNYPISYVAMIDGAQLTQGEVTSADGQSVFHVTQVVNLTPQDAYQYYMDLYGTSPSYTVTNSKEGESLSFERSKNGIVANLQFVADQEGSSQVIMEVSVAE